MPALAKRALKPCRGSQCGWACRRGMSGGPAGAAGAGGGRSAAPGALRQPAGPAAHPGPGCDGPRGALGHCQRLSRQALWPGTLVDFMNQLKKLIAVPLEVLSGPGAVPAVVVCRVMVPIPPCHTLELPYCSSLCFAASRLPMPAPRRMPGFRSLYWPQAS